MTIIDIDGLDNVRDLGGYPAGEGYAVRSGMIYRGDRLSNASEAGLKKLASLGIKNYYDLRDPTQAGKYPDPEIEGANMHLTPAEIYSDLENDLPIGAIAGENEQNTLKLIELHEKHYTTIARHPDATKEIMNTMLAGGAPVYFHCTAGKDRTGITAAIILSALGVPRSVIVEDYMLSRECRRERSEKRISELYGGWLPGSKGRLIKCYFDVDTEWLDRLFDVMDNEYGGVEQYIEGAIGMDAGQRARFKEMFLEKQ